MKLIMFKFRFRKNVPNDPVLIQSRFLRYYFCLSYKLKNKGLKPFKFLTKTLHKVPSHNAAPLIQMKTYPVPDCLKKLNHVMYTNTQKTYVNVDENYHQSYNNE